MRTRLPIIAMAAFLLFTAAACQSTTAVDRSDRASVGESDTPAPTTAAAPDADPDADDRSSLGTGEQVESLRVDCVAGSDQACDLLYQLAPFNSEEESIALDCAGRRSNASPFCTADVNAEPETLWFSEDSPGLPDIVDACEDGDMTACDFLFFRAPIGSSYEILGTTCGERTTVAIPDCRTMFADPGS